MREEEQNKILVFIRGMLDGMIGHRASKSAGGQKKDGEFMVN